MNEKKNFFVFSIFLYVLELLVPLFDEDDIEVENEPMEAEEDINGI